MPRREDIERFTQVLNSLGGEPAIRALRSETIEEVPAPEEQPVAEGQDVFDTILAGEQAPSEGGEQESLQNLFEGLSALPEEPQAPEAPAPEEPSGPGIPEDSEGLDLASLLGEETGTQSIEDIGSEPAGLQSDLSQMEALPEDLGEAGAQPGGEAAPATGAPEPEIASFGDLGSFPIEAAETVAPAEGGDVFELPSLDDLSFAEPDGTLAQAPPTSEEPSFDAPSVEAPLQTGAAEEMPSFEGLEPPRAGPAGEQPTESEELAGLGEEGLGDLNLDEFSLPESAEAFGVPPEQPAAPAPRPAPRKAPPRTAPARPRPAAARPAPKVEAPEAALAEIELTPEQFAGLKKSLESLPRNLKIVVQDLIGQGTISGADLAKLVSLLLAGASAREIAQLAGRVSGKRIRIPEGYEKKTGVAFEAEQRTFAYAFRENIFPLLRTVVITVLAGGILGFFGYRFVYRPLYAFASYRAGYAQIRNDRFSLGNESFGRAAGVWPMKAWFYRYADAFAAKRQYVLAEAKYDDLLARFGDDKKGILDYARMESSKLADYEKADTLLQRILKRSMYDYEALLAIGDNNIEWADRVPARYEDARRAYATLIDENGAKDELLFRMLRYFIRTDNGNEVERLRAYYEGRPDVKVDAPAYAELGGYLVDHRRLDYVQDVLFRADKMQPNMYEVHYHLARYYRIVRSPEDERKALEATEKLLLDTDALTRKRLSIAIDTHSRFGEFYYGIKEYLSAEKELQTAIRLVEQNQNMKLIGRDRMFGRPYAVLGDLYYYIQGDLATANLQYHSAITNLYTDPELTYKLGYIQYASQDYKGALSSFTAAEDESAYPSGSEPITRAAEGETAEGSAPGEESAPAALPAIPGQPPSNLLFALGNCFYQRGDFFAAQGYFLRLLERLQTRQAAIGILAPEEKPEDRALLDSLEKVNNNLGITMVKLAERSGDRRRKSEGMVYLTSAAEIADSLARSPDSVRRSETRSLPSLNMRGILYPVTGFIPQIYKALPKDFVAITW